MKLRLALGLACVALLGCARGRRALRRPPAPLAVFGVPLASGHARFEAGVLTVSLDGGAGGCAARAPSPSLTLRVPAGPRGDHFVGARIGVRVEARGLGARAAFGLDAEEVALQLDAAEARPSGRVRGRLELAERYRRGAGARARGGGRFEAIVCEVANGAPGRLEIAARDVEPRLLGAHVATLPDGGRALTRLRLAGAAAGVTLEHPGGAADGRVRLGAAQPARVRLADGTIGWDAWVRFDALDLGPGGRVAGALDARAGALRVRGAFEGRVEPGNE